MLAKLLKDEIKATSGLLGLLSAAALAVGVVGGLMLRYVLESAAAQREDAMISVVSSMLVFVFLALFAYVFGSGIYLAFQFYRRKFTDEGYLTFTLPVRSWQIFLSSLLNMLMWSLVTGIVMIIALVLIFLIGLLNTEFLRQVSTGFREMQDIFSYSFSTAMPDVSVPLQIAGAVVEFVMEKVVLMTCVTLGAILARRRKILGAVGVYLGFSMISGSVTTCLMTSYLNTDMGWTMNAFYIVSFVYSLALSVGCFILSCWLMEKKLNLP